VLIKRELRLWQLDGARGLMINDHIPTFADAAYSAKNYAVGADNFGAGHKRCVKRGSGLLLRGGDGCFQIGLFPSDGWAFFTFTKCAAVQCCGHIAGVEDDIVPFNSLHLANFSAGWAVNSGA